MINLIYFFHRFLYHMIYFAVYVFGTQWKVEMKKFGCCMLSDIEIFRYVFFKIIWSVLNIRIISYFDRIANRAMGRNTKTSSSFIILSSIYSRESYRSVTYPIIFLVVRRHDQKFVHFKQKHCHSAAVVPGESPYVRKRAITSLDVRAIASRSDETHNSH